MMTGSLREKLNKLYQIKQIYFGLEEPFDFDLNFRHSVPLDFEP